MPLVNGKFSIQPQQASALHGKHQKPATDKATQYGEPSAAGHDQPAHHVEIHHPTSPIHGDGKNFHTVTHHATGEPHHAKHASFHEASAHAGNMMQAEEAQMDNGMEGNETGDNSEMYAGE